MYTASPLTVKPICSQVFGVGYFMGALPFAFAISLVWYAIGWFNHRKIIAKEDKSH